MKWISGVISAGFLKNIEATKFIITVKIDLFWNAKSFQEMEPEVVANYLNYVNKQANAVFLQEVMSGAKIAGKKGEPGVLKQTKLEDYKNGLANFQLIDMAPSMLPASKLSRYSDSFWRRIL